MSFFNQKQKELALASSPGILRSGYELSEFALMKAALHGDETELKKAMKEHGDFEYALLFQQTPEFKKLKSRLGKR